MHTGKLLRPGNRWAKRCLAAIVLFSLVAAGCRSPAEHRADADQVASTIITAKQEEALGKTEPFDIERPSDILRRRLIEEQGLPISGEASLGTDELAPIPHWPEKDYPPAATSADANIPVEPNRPLRISLLDALQIGARNSRDYQAQKERVFQSALALDLARNEFRTVFTMQADSSLTRNIEADENTLAAGGTAGVGRTLKNGLDISAALAIDLVQLLPGVFGRTLTADPSVSIPLLRGAGRHIVTEPLTQAERSVIYRMWEFERYKRSFAVTVARDYYDVLRQMDSVKNNENNYRSAIQSARWSRRQADAGRIPEIEVDQAVQRELSSRNSWISAQASLKDRLDAFKMSIGLPVDALIELDPNDLVQLGQRANQYLETMRAAKTTAAETVPPADARVSLVQPTKEGAGPYEIDETLAVRLALENRLDLRVANGEVYDAQRQVVVAADDLRATLTAGANARLVANDNDGSLGFESHQYSGLLTLDLPIDPRSRTRERNNYRTSLINLEAATRSVQELEDQVKLAIRGELRTLLESRESLKIQAQSVVVAEKRVRSAGLFLEAGRAQIRDLLEAQDALLSAQNSLTAAVVNYRTAELQFQRDLDVLEVNEQGLWREFSPEVLE
jgi:outer membrane protein TolC